MISRAFMAIGDVFARFVPEHSFGGDTLVERAAYEVSEFFYRLGWRFMRHD